jgi:hypothetical protein
MLRREVIGQLECPLLHRWTLLSCRAGKLLVHHFLPTVRDRDPHDHPRPFLTLVLRGGYDDIALCRWCQGRRVMGCLECGETGYITDRLRAPAIRYRAADHAHITVAGPRGAWTLVVMGPLVRAWGFLRDGRWWSWRAYEGRYGGSFRCPE